MRHKTEDCYRVADQLEAEYYSPAAELAVEIIRSLAKEVGEYRQQSNKKMK